MPRFTGTGIGPGQPQVRCQGGVKDVRVLAHSPITVRTASAWRAVMPTPPGMAFPRWGRRTAAAPWPASSCLIRSGPPDSSCAASGTSTTTASATPGSAPDRTVSMPRKSCPTPRPRQRELPRRPRFPCRVQNGSRCVTRQVGCRHLLECGVPRAERDKLAGAAEQVQATRPRAGRGAARPGARPGGRRGWRSLARAAPPRAG